MTCPNHASFLLLTVARRGSCGPTGILLRTLFVGLALLVGDREKFPQGVGLKRLDPFFRVSKQGPCFTAIVEDGGDKRLV